jgi:hypothetical protein
MDDLFSLETKKTLRINNSNSKLASDSRDSYRRARLRVWKAVCYILCYI